MDEHWQWGQLGDGGERFVVYQEHAFQGLTNVRTWVMYRGIMLTEARCRLQTRYGTHQPMALVR